MIAIGINYYKDISNNRQEELNYCLQKNIENKHVTTIILMCNREESLYIYKRFNTDKMILLIGTGRPTYNNFIEHLSNVSEPIKAIINTDIYLDRFTSNLFDKIKDGELWALSRWDQTSDGSKLWKHRDSQDVWAWRGSMHVQLGADFSLGRACGANRIAKIFSDSGYKILNPSMDVKTIHVHASNIRNYDPRIPIPPPYHFIAPHKL